MLTDVTVRITPKTAESAGEYERKVLSGHIGTHFDVMDKEFSLEYAELDGVVFDASGVEGRDIDVGDVDLSRVKKGMFAAFYTGFIEKEGYGGKNYFTLHPQLSFSLIDALLDAGAAIIGVDFAGVRRGAEHTPTDARCAERGTFIVENLCNLKPVADAGGDCVMYTFPMNFSGMTGLPCRVAARIKEKA